MAGSNQEIPIPKLTWLKLKIRYTVKFLQIVVILPLEKMCFLHDMERYVICLRFLRGKHGKLITRMVSREIVWRNCEE